MTGQRTVTPIIFICSSREHKKTSALPLPIDLSLARIRQPIIISPSRQAQRSGVKMPGMKVVMRALKSIRPYAKNPRDNKSAVSAVARSIAEFGFRQPIVVDKKGTIIVGHTRYLAAIELKLDRVPVHVADDLSPAKRKAYRIADNQTGALSAWNFDKLIAEVGDLGKASFDLSALGFKKRRLNELVSLEAEAMPPEGRVALGEAWEVMVECTDEKHQKKIYDRLTKEGLKCRLLVL